MAVREKAVTDVEVNGQNAGKVLDELKKKAESYKDAMVAANKANNLEAYQKAQQELKKTEASMNQLKKASFDVNAVLKNLSGSSLPDLKKAQAAITKELSGMTRGTKEYVAASNSLQKVEAEIKKVKTEMHGAAGAQESFFSKASAGFNKYFGMITAGVAAFTGVAFGVRKAIDAYNEFQKSVSTLSSLTGLQGDDLKWLADQAKILSTSTTESGVRITSSAVDIVEAYKLMGSARPELLKNKEDLNEVTKQALILKEAAGIELNEAVQAVASSMNQFNLGASESERVINVLAAGALEGSSEISDLTGSMKNFGPVAKDSNLSLEQSVALLEVLGTKAIKGEEAGTKLRGSILKLKEAGLGYASGQFNMADALEEANKKISEQSSNLDKDALKIKYFGAENVTTGTILLNNIDLYKSLTTAVTGTSEATRQAAINTDNNSAKLEQAKNQAQLNAIALGEKLAPALILSTNGFSFLMKAVIAIIDVFKTHGRLIITSMAAIAAYTIAVKAAAIAESLRNKESLVNIAISKAKVVWDNAVKAGVLLLAAAKAVLTGNIVRANAAMALFNQTTKLNPFGLLLAVIAAVVVGLAAYSKRIADVNAAQKMLIDLNVEAKKSIAGEKAEIERLLIISRDEQRSKEDRLAAIKKLNSISPEYLGNLTLENINTKDATKATEEYIKVLEKKALISAAQEKLIELEKQFIDLKNDGTGAEIRWYQTLWNAISTGGNLASYITKQAITGAMNIDAAFKELALKKKALMGLLTQNVELPINQPTEPNDSNNSNTGGLSKKEIADNNKKVLDELEKAYNERRLVIIKFNQKYNLDQDGLNQSLLANEIAYLKLKEEALRKSGENTTVLQAEIATKEMQLQDNITKAQQDANIKKGQSDKEYYDAQAELSKKQTDENKKELDKRNADDEKAHQEKAQHYENIKGITDNLATSLGETFGNMASNAEMTSQDFAKALILIALDSLHAIVRMSIAEIWAKQIATKGFVGIGTSIVLSGLVEAAFAGVKAVVNNSLSKKSSGSKTKQHFRGNIDAIGAEDGKTYTAPYVGYTDYPTYYPNTFIGSERGGEFVIDAGRSRNIRMRYPQLLEAIRAVPQHASGTLPASPPSVPYTPPTTDPNILLFLQQNAAINAALVAELQKGVIAKMSFDHYNEQIAKGNKAISDVSRNVL